MLAHRCKLKVPCAPCTFHEASFMSVSWCCTASCRCFKSIRVLATIRSANSSRFPKGTGGPRADLELLFKMYIVCCPGLGCTSPHMRTQLALHRLLYGFVTSPSGRVVTFRWYVTKCLVLLSVVRGR